MSDGSITACQKSAGNQPPLHTWPGSTVVWCNSRCGLTRWQSLSSSSLWLQKQPRSPSAMPRFPPLRLLLPDTGAPPFYQSGSWFSECPKYQFSVNPSFFSSTCCFITTLSSLALQQEICLITLCNLKWSSVSGPFSCPVILVAGTNEGPAKQLVGT